MQSHFTPPTLSRLAFFLVCLLAGFSGVFAQSEGDYRSRVTGNWATAATWERFTAGSWVTAGVAPTSTDGIITIQSLHTVTVAAATSADEVVVAPGGTLAVNATFSILDGPGDDLTVNGTMNSGFTINGGASTGTILVNGTWNWSAGTVSVSSTIAATGTLNLNTTASKTLSNASITNNGTTNWNVGNVITASGIFNNNANFNITSTVDGNWGITPTGTNAFNNFSGATITKSVGTTAAIYLIPLNNNSGAAIQLNSGILRQNGGTFTNNGSITFTSGTILEATNTGIINFAAGTTISGPSNYKNRLSGTTQVNTPVSFEQVELRTGNISGSSTMTITGWLQWINVTVSTNIVIASTAYATLFENNKTLNAASLTNNGTIAWKDSATIIANNITLSNGASIVNNAGATFIESFTLSRSILPGTGSGTFTNTGRILKVTPTLNMSINVPFTNTGVIEGQGGVLFGGTVANTGIMEPGDVIGSMTTTPNTFTGNSPTYVSTISNLSGPANGNDVIVVNGTGVIDLSGTDLEIPFSAAPLGTYTIMQATGTATFAGTFASVSHPGGYSAPVVTPTTVTITRTALLPVVWGAFDLKKTPAGTEAIWETLQEINVSHFDVEHSADGVQFSKIGTQQAVGTSAKASTYRFLHSQPSSGQNFYRIRQVDKDGKFTYSTTKSIRTGSGKKLLNIVENPSRTKLAMQLDEVSQLIVTDGSGKRITSQKLNAGTNLINISSWKEGVYFVTAVADSGEKETVRFVKQ